MKVAAGIHYFGEERAKTQKTKRRRKRRKRIYSEMAVAVVDFPAFFFSKFFFVHVRFLRYNFS